MKKHLFYLAICCLGIIGVLSSSTIYAATPESCFVYYTINGDEATITNYNAYNAGCGPNVVIPSTLSGKTVTKIGDNAFWFGYGDANKHLTSVIIPNTVITIGNRAFFNNSITTLEIPDSVTTIGSFSFSQNDLTNLILSNSLTEIPNSAFDSSTNLTNVVIPNGVTRIGDTAFAWDNLTSIVIPGSLQTVENQAFIYQQGGNDVRLTCAGYAINPSIHYNSHAVLDDTCKLFNLAINTASGGFIATTASGIVYNSGVLQSPVLGKANPTNVVDLNITPNSGYYLKNLTVSGATLNESVSSGTLNYTFTMPTNDVKITPEFEREVYTIKFVNEDGTVISTGSYYYGDTVIEPATPTKAPTAEFTYSFNGWSSIVSSVTGDITYTATFTSTTNEYTITWQNEDGIILETDTNVAYGTTPSYDGITPTKTGDAQYSYTFVGWSPVVANVTGNVEYTAMFTSNPISNPSSGYSGGGRRTKVESDDNLKKNSETEIKEGDQKENKTEMDDAYEFAYRNGITTMDTIEKADMDGYLIRSHLAKMLSQFAVNVMGKTPDLGKRGCGDFADIQGKSEELKGYMKTACELGLMGLESDGKTVAQNFNPNNYVTRAEFGTTLSRLLYGDSNNLNSEYDKANYEWYEKHLLALKENGIMTQITGEWITNKELRGYVMLMLMRSVK